MARHLSRRPDPMDLLRCEAGVAAIEFAIFAPMIIIGLLTVVDIGRAITYLRSLGKIAIVLVEQYLDFARELGDRFVVMDRGAIVLATWREDMDEAALKKAMAL